MRKSSRVSVPASGWYSHRKLPQATGAKSQERRWAGSCSRDTTAGQPMAWKSQDRRSSRCTLRMKRCAGRRSRSSRGLCEQVGQRGCDPGWPDTSERPMQLRQNRCSQLVIYLRRVVKYLRRGVLFGGELERGVVGERNICRLSVLNRREANDRKHMFSP